LAGVTVSASRSLHAGAAQCPSRLIRGVEQNTLGPMFKIFKG